MKTLSPKDITGKSFNLLTAVKFSRNAGDSRYWIFKCACGTEKEIQRGSVVSGVIKSCGCLRRSIKLSRQSSPEPTSNYERWRGMIRRCYNPNHRDYHLYGGRGIVVCDRWKNSMADFIKDMGPRPSRKHSLDRIDNNGNYEPSNCRWATSLDQGNNKRTNRKIEFQGECLTMAQWERKIGGRKHLIRDRIRSGMTELQAVSTPLPKKP